MQAGKGVALPQMQARCSRGEDFGLMARYHWRVDEIRPGVVCPQCGTECSVDLTGMCSHAYCPVCSSGSDGHRRDNAPPIVPSDEKNAEADSLNNRAVLCASEGRESEANGLWEEALGIAPLHVEVTYNLRISEWRGALIDDEEVLQELSKVREGCSDTRRTDYLLGLVHLERGDGQAAVEALEQSRTAGNASPVVDQALQHARNLEPAIVQTFDQGAIGTTSAHLAADGDRIVSLDMGWRLRTWDIATGQCTGTHDTGDMCAGCWSTDGRLALFAGKNGRLQLWDVTLGRCVQAFGEHPESVYTVCLGSGGHWAVSACGGWPNKDYDIPLWHTRSGQCVRTFQGHERAVAAACLSRDNRWILSAAWDRTLRLWDAQTGQCVRIFQDHREAIVSLRLTEDARWAVSGSKEGLFRLWDVSSGLYKFTMLHGGPIMSACLSRDGRWGLSGRGIVTGKAPCAIRLWELETGRCLRTFHAHSAFGGTRGYVSTVCFDEGGRRFLSAGMDGVIRLWNMPASRKAPWACSTNVTEGVDG